MPGYIASESSEPSSRAASPSWRGGSDDDEFTPVDPLERALEEALIEAENKAR